MKMNNCMLEREGLLNVVRRSGRRNNAEIRLAHGKVTVEDEGGLTQMRD
jgi:hypothetical protein